jgi:hypothetical protein
MDLKNSTALSRGPDLARDREILLGQLGHALFDGRQVFRRERTLVGEVVVEAVFDHRTDGHLRLGEQLLDRVGQQVRGRMADDVEAVGILVGDDGQRASRSIRNEVSTSTPSTLAGQRRLGQAGADQACLQKSNRAHGSRGNHAVRPAHQFGEILSQRLIALRHHSALDHKRRQAMDIDGFMENYKRAWETSDENLLASLFTPTAPIATHPSPSSRDTRRSSSTGSAPSCKPTSSSPTKSCSVTPAEASPTGTPPIR